MSVSAPIMSAASDSSSELQHFAKENITKLSKLPTFSSWGEADFHIQPLGPGTHSWLVSISQKEITPSRCIGYMVISVNAIGQYVLVEYGSGEDSIYHPDKLQEAISSLNLSLDKLSVTAKPYYGGPTWTEWRISKEEFIHAVTGEQLPQDLSSWDTIAQSYVASLENMSISHDPIPKLAMTTGSSFDPYEQISWMASKPLPIQSNTFIDTLVSKHQLIYAGAEANRTYHIPLPITGYQEWDGGNVYVQAGTATSPRFIALDSLLSLGHFLTTKVNN